MPKISNIIYGLLISTATFSFYKIKKIPYCIHCELRHHHPLCLKQCFWCSRTPTKYHPYFKISRYKRDCNSCLWCRNQKIGTWCNRCGKFNT